MQLNRVEIRRLTRPLQNIPLFEPSKTPGLFFLYVLGPFVLWSAAESASLHVTESEQRVYLYTSGSQPAARMRPVTNPNAAHHAEHK